MKNQFLSALLPPIIFLFLSSLPFWFSDLDIIAQKPFFDAQKGWFMSETPFWEFVYKFGIFPGYFLALAALVIISMSYWRINLIPWRKPALFLLFVLAIAPGILVNLVLKDHWGRPRPRDIVAFGGAENYLPPGEIGAHQGKSFPCGHCSMGFFMALPFLFMRKKYKIAAYVFLFSGLFFGILIGLARMMAGGHFLSDMLWSGGIVWLVAALGYRLLKLDREVEIRTLDTGVQKRKAGRVTLFMGILLPVLTVSLLLATPYISKKEFYKTTEELKATRAGVIHTQIEEGNLHIVQGTKLQINYRVNAFGFPNSKLRSKWLEGKGDTAKYFIEKLGWFTEVSNHFEITYPFGNGMNYYISVEEGKIFLEIPENAPSVKLNIRVKDGEIHLKGKDFQLSFNKANPPRDALGKSLSTEVLKHLSESKSPFQVKTQVEKGSLEVDLEN